LVIIMAEPCRKRLEEVHAWSRLERAYEENLKAAEMFVESTSRSEGRFLLVCDGRVVGVFETYEEAAKKSEEVCSVNALIPELPLKRVTEEVELGFPW